MKGAKKSSRKKSLNVIIPLVVYPFDAIVSIGESDKELNRVLKRQDIEWDDQLSYEGAGRCAILTNNTVIIRVYRYPSCPEDYDTLAHEIFHAVDFTFRAIGMSLVKESAEAYAYLIGYLTRKIYEVIK